MNVIPLDSRLFECARKGDVHGIQELFASKEASPFDCDGEIGYTALHFAALRAEIGLCRFLIEQGADADYQDHHGDPPVVMTFKGNPESKTGLDTVRLLLVEAEVTPPLTGFYFRYAANFRNVQNVVDPEYYARPLKERISVAMRLYLAEPDVFRLAISLDSEIPVEAIEHRDGKGDTLMHGLAHHIVIATDRKYLELIQMGDKEQLQGWRSILSELISKGADLSVVNYYQRTPFFSFIRLYLWCNDPELDNVTTFTENSRMLTLWLGSLQACGADLLQYGATEVALLKRGLTFWNFPSADSDYSYDLIELQCGPELSDWKMVFKRLSRQVKVDVPGGWVEDDAEEGDIEEDDDEEHGDIQHNNSQR